MSMKSLVLGWIWVFSVLSVPLFAGGGPDLFGYTWLDSNDTLPNAPVYNWVEIRTRPGAVNLNLNRDDAVSSPVPMQFNFLYYWTNYNEIKIGTNGYCGFDNVRSIALCLDPIPTPGGQGDNFIGAMLSDLTFAENFAGFPNPGEIWYWSNQVDSFVISWIEAPFWRDPNVFGSPDFWGTNTFQVILSAQDTSITFQYQHINPSKRASDPACLFNSEIGIENVTGNVGLAAYSDTLPTDTLSYAIRFIYPDTPGFRFPDPTPRWNANEDNKGQFFFKGDFVEMQTNLANVGNEVLVSNTRVTGRLTTLNPLDIRWEDTVWVPQLGIGMDTTLGFPDSAFLATSGQYSYTVRSQNPDDFNLSNNQNTVEISAIDASQSLWSLTYCTLNPPDGAISWGVGPDYGVGMYIAPPPAWNAVVQVSGIDLYILSFDPANAVGVKSGFRLNIYEEDSLGNPGQLLHSHAVPVDSVIADNWNYISFDSLVMVPSFNFYVAWLHDGDSISLGTEEFGPISRRTYEILAGQWAPYRDGGREDFLMVINLASYTGIAEPTPSKLDVKVYPNPATEWVKIELEQPRRGPVNISLYDLNGVRVWHAEHPSIPEGNHRWSAPLGGLPAGFYLMKIQSGNQQKVTKLAILSD